MPSTFSLMENEELTRRMNAALELLPNAKDSDLSENGRAALMDEVTAIQHELFFRGLGPDPAGVDVYGEPWEEEPYDDGPSAEEMIALNYPGYDAATEHYERFGRPAFPNEY